MKNIVQYTVFTFTSNFTLNHDIADLDKFISQLYLARTRDALLKNKVHEIISKCPSSVS